MNCELWHFQHPMVCIQSQITSSTIIPPLILQNIFHGAMSLDQLYWTRPSSRYPDYTTPVQGLYLCGSSAHPGECAVLYVMFAYSSAAVACNELHSTLPNPVTSLYRAPFWRRCHGKHGAHVHRNAYAWSRARGRMYVHNVHVSMYACTCMCFTLHSELRAYPSYGRPPRRRCPDKGGLSVSTVCRAAKLSDFGPMF